MFLKSLGRWYLNWWNDVTCTKSITHEKQIMNTTFCIFF